MRHVIFLLCCLAYGAAVNGQTNDRSGKDYALFFAVNDYQSMTDLKNPIQNARDIALELRENYNFKTEVVENPTLTMIEDKLAEYKARFASGTYDQKGQLLIFFTGHGTMQGHNGYFMPSDVKPTLAHRTALDYDYLRYEIDNFACQHIMVTVDACHSGTFDPDFGKNDRNFGRKGGGKDQVLLHHDAYRARLFITSDAQGVETPDNSNLARKFLLALRSHRSQTGYLTHDELMGTYLKQASPIPGGGEFGSDEAASRFLFFRKTVAVPVNARADIAAWNQAKAANTCAAYRGYLQQYANGDFAALARQKTIACEEEERMLTAWAAVRDKGNVSDYEGFLEKYPNSPYAEAARLKIKEYKETMREILLLGNDDNEKNVPDNMIFIKGGVFQMGDQFGDGGFDEAPVHAVALSDFYLSRTELTVGEFADFIEATGYTTTAEKEGDSYVYTSKWETKKGVTWRDDTEGKNRPVSEYNHPVIHVSWYDAVAYCNWLSGQHGLTPVYRMSGTTVTSDWKANGYRLPTEAEWEYAARSGGKKKKWTGTSTESSLSQFANHSGKKDGYERTAPVGMLRANNLGLADMTGNVLEWCWDWYGSDYYGESSGGNPRGPRTDSNRVLRGGSWYFNPKYCRASLRYRNNPDNRHGSFGFRLARSY